MELNQLSKTIDKMLQGKPVDWNTERQEALKQIQSMLKSMKEMEGVVPEEIYDTKKAPIELNNQEASAYLYGYNACRSQLLLGLAGFAERLPEILQDEIGDYVTPHGIEQISQAILTELKGEK